MIVSLDTRKLVPTGEAAFRHLLHLHGILAALTSKGLGHTSAFSCLAIESIDRFPELGKPGVAPFLSYLVTGSLEIVCHAERQERRPSSFVL